MFSFLYKKIRTDKKIELQKKFPDNLFVEIEPFDDGEGYYIRVKNLEGCNTSTRSKDSKDIFEMINDAVYTYLEIPEDYQPFMPTYLPLEDVRKEFEEGIPADFLNKILTLSRV
jgi:predicted RNase H-like HicB family nuclease